MLHFVLTDLLINKGNDFLVLDIKISNTNSYPGADRARLALGFDMEHLGLLVNHVPDWRTDLSEDDDEAFVEWCVAKPGMRLRALGDAAQEVAAEVSNTGKRTCVVVAQHKKRAAEEAKAKKGGAGRASGKQGKTTATATKGIKRAPKPSVASKRKYSGKRASSGIGQQRQQARLARAAAAAAAGDEGGM